MTKAEEILKRLNEKDQRVARVYVYTDPFVPNSYRWPILGNRLVALKTIRGVETLEESYDRKRSNGIGPKWVAFSERGGRLYSSY